MRFASIAPEPPPCEAWDSATIERSGGDGVGVPGDDEFAAHRPSDRGDLFVRWAWSVPSQKAAPNCH